jgi:hypothetical protein
MQNFDSTLTLVAVAALVVFGIWLGIRIVKWRTSWRIGRNRRLGTRGEKRAVKLLEKAGYTIEADQAPGEVRVEVDGKVQAFKLRADFMVTCKGKRYVVETKGGKTAASLGTATTRRQLLEYAIAYDTDGVLLVDAARGEVHTIDFPQR